MSANPNVFYATLYDTYRRTPLYSANRVKLSLEIQKTTGPSLSYFSKRVATGLCDLGNNSISKNAIYSNIAIVKEQLTLEKCKNLQVVNDDYRNNNINLTRGHLSPSHING